MVNNIRYSGSRNNSIKISKMVKVELYIDIEKFPGLEDIPNERIYYNDDTQPILNLCDKLSGYKG